MISHEKIVIVAIHIIDLYIGWDSVVHVEPNHLLLSTVSVEHVSRDLGWSWSRGRDGPRAEVEVEVEKIGLRGDTSGNPSHLTSMRPFTPLLFTENKTVRKT